MYDSPVAVYLYVYSIDAGSTDQLIERSVIRYRWERLGRKDVSVAIRRTAKGKPFLPEWNDIFVSVTHSGDYCIIGVANYELGIDLQIHDPLHSESSQQATERYLRLSKRFFHPDEHAYVCLSPDEHFFDVWCAKESYVKYTGNGIDDVFRIVNILPAFQSEPLLNWRACDVCFRVVWFNERYTLCVCTEKQAKIHLIWSDTNE